MGAVVAVMTDPYSAALAAAGVVFEDVEVEEDE